MSCLLGLAARDPVGALRRANAPLGAGPLAIKLKALSRSPWAYFRGSAPVFYADAAHDARLGTSVEIPLQGDLHLENLGVLPDATGSLTFDLDDFDEAGSGPYTWELARCAISIRLAFNGADDLVRRYLDRYARDLAELAVDPGRLARPIPADRLSGVAARALDRARHQDRAGLLGHFAPTGQLLRNERVATPEAGLAAAAREAFRGYVEAEGLDPDIMTLKDLTQRQEGVGSLGRVRLLLLVEGPTEDAGDDLVIELKEEFPLAWGKNPGDAGERVRKATQYFRPGCDRYLGNVKFRGDSYLVHELSPWHVGVELDELRDAAERAAYVETVALATARAHARSGKAAAILADLRAGQIEAVARDGERDVKADQASLKRSVEAGKPSL